MRVLLRATFLHCRYYDVGFFIFFLEMVDFKLFSVTNSHFFMGALRICSGGKCYTNNFRRSPQSGVHYEHYKRGSVLGASCVLRMGKCLARISWKGRGAHRGAVRCLVKYASTIATSTALCVAISQSGILHPLYLVMHVGESRAHLFFVFGQFQFSPRCVA